MTTSKKVSRGRGRPAAIEVDAKTFKIVTGLGKIQATTRECAAVLGVSHQTFIATMQRYPEIGEALDIGKEQGKVSLRRTQFRLAQKNAGMAIFLGKNYLEQTDRQDITGLVTAELRITDARSALEHLIDRQSAARAGKDGASRLN